MAGALLVGALRTGVDDVMGGHHSDRRTALVQGHTERMESRVRYAEIRPYTVPETLEELAGPAAGVVALPTALDWTPKRVYDLSDDADLRMLYERSSGRPCMRGSCGSSLTRYCSRPCGRGCGFRRECG